MLARAAAKSGRHGALRISLILSFWDDGNSSLSVYGRTSRSSCRPTCMSPHAYARWCSIVVPPSLKASRSAALARAGRCCSGSAWRGPLRLRALARVGRTLSSCIRCRSCAGSSSTSSGTSQDKEQVVVRVCCACARRMKLAGQGARSSSGTLRLRALNETCS